MKQTLFVVLAICCSGLCHADDLKDEIDRKMKALKPKIVQEEVHELLLKRGFTPVPMVDITNEHNQFQVECTVGMDKVFFLVDTGADTTIIDESLAKKLKLPVGDEVTINSFGTKSKAYLTVLPEFRIGDFDLRTSQAAVRVVVMKMSERMTKNKIVGILGYDLLKMHATQISYPNKMLYLRTQLKVIWPTLEGTWSDTMKVDSPTFVFADEILSIKTDKDVQRYGMHISLPHPRDKSLRVVAWFNPKKIFDVDFTYTAWGAMKIETDKLTFLMTTEPKLIGGEMPEPDSKLIDGYTRYQLIRKK